MSRIDDILENVRDMVGDADGDRWSDAVLLRSLNRGQQEIAVNANLLRDKEGQPLRRGIYLYDTPLDCYRPKRFTLNSEKVILKSHDEMDEEYSATWEETEGEADLIVYDKLNWDNFRVYPIVETSFLELSFTVVVAPQVPESSSPVAYGIVTLVSDYTFSSPYGLYADFDTDDYQQYYDLIGELEETGDEDHGIVIVIEDASVELMTYYTKNPAKITATTDSLEISKVWDTALEYFMAGKALLNNKDTQDRQLGDNFMSLFGAKVGKAKDDASKDFTDTKKQYREKYNTGFDRVI